MRKAILVLMAVLLSGAAFSNALTEAALSSVRLRAPAKAAAKSGRVLMASAPDSGCRVTLAFTGEQDEVFPLPVTRGTVFEFDFTGDKEMEPLCYVVTEANPPTVTRFDAPTNGVYSVTITSDTRIDVVCRRPIYVDHVESGNVLPPNVSAGYYPTNALGTIQAAVDLALDGAEVRVRGGCSYAPFAVTNRELRIVSADRQNAAVIDGGGTSRCVEIAEAYTNVLKQMSEDDPAYKVVVIPATNGLVTVEGFTLTNGSTKASGGGAWGGTLLACRIAGCRADGDGGGLFGAEARNCLVTGCSAGGDGAGAAASVLKNCTVAGNAVTGTQTAVALGARSYNSVVSGNGRTTQIGDGCLSLATFTTGVIFDGTWHLRPNSAGIKGGLQEFVEDDYDLEGNLRRDGVNVTAGCFQNEAQSGVPTVGVTVDGTDLSLCGGNGWEYDPVTSNLTIAAEGSYVLAGAATGVTVRIAASASLFFNDLRIDGSSGPVLSVADGKALTVSGGTADLSGTEDISGTVVIAGGSINLYGKSFLAAVNVYDRPVRLLAVEGLSAGTVSVEGLVGYEARGMRVRQGGVLYLWLPDGSGTFRITDAGHPGGVNCLYVVTEFLAFAEIYDKAPSADVGLAVNGTDVRILAGEGWVYFPVSSNLMVVADGDYTLSGSSCGPWVSVMAHAGVTFDDFRMDTCGSAVIVSDDAEMTVRGGTGDLHGTDDVQGRILIDGGSFCLNGQSVNPAPSNTAGRAVYCVMVGGLESLVGSRGLVSLEGLDGYGVDGIRLIDGKLYLWLPEGDGVFWIIDPEDSKNFLFCEYSIRNGIVDVNVRPPIETGVTVNGMDAGVMSGEGWVYHPKFAGGDGYVELTGAGPYVLSGTNTAGEVMFSVAASAAVTLSNLCLKCTTVGECCLWVTNNTTVALYLAGTNTLDASGDATDTPMGEGLCVGNGTRVTVSSAPGFVDEDAVLHAIGSYERAAIAVGRNGSAGAKPYFAIAGGTVIANRGDGPAWYSTGIGVSKANGDAGNNGESDIVISGGRVLAEGGRYSPGIGSADRVQSGAPCIRITGGFVEAVGKDNAAAIGSAPAGRFENVIVEGGTVSAAGGSFGTDIGLGQGGYQFGGVTYGGGSVLLKNNFDWCVPSPTNAVGERVYCVTVDVRDQGSGIGDRGVVLEGLEGYGTTDIVPIDGKVYLWLPNGTYTFRADGIPYRAEVSDGPVTAVLNADLWVNYLDWNGSELVEKTTWAYALTRTTVLGNDNWYVVTGKVTTTDLRVSGTAHLILADGAKLTANASGWRAGVEVSSGNTLFIYGQTLGTGELEARGDNCGAGVGGNDGETCGSVTINGGVVGAYGGLKGAGIGSGWLGGCGSITINGGRVTAVGKGPDSYGVIYAGAGIGSGVYGFGGTVTINGGTVKATGADGANSNYADDIGVGASARGSAAVTVNGGSVWRTRNRGPQPKDSAQRPLYCVTVDGLADGDRVRLEGLEGYGVCDIYPIGGKAYLWLPNGAYVFRVNGKQYSARVKDGAATARAGVWFDVDYLDWNGSSATRKSVWARFVDGDAIGNGEWSVVTGAVSIASLSVNGTANLILADGAKLTVNGDVAGGTINVYGQDAESGELAVTGALGSSLTVKGGRIAANAVGGTAKVGGGTVSQVASGATLTVDGGSVFAASGVSAKNSAGTAVYPVTVEGLGDAAKVEDLEDYGVHGICPVDGKVCLWLPNGKYAFCVNDVPYVAKVQDGPTTATVDKEDRIAVGCIDCNGDVVERKTRWAHVLFSGATEIGKVDWYVVTGVVEVAGLKMSEPTHLIIADGAKLTVNGDITGEALAVYGQEASSGELVAAGTVAAPLTVKGGRISATESTAGTVAVCGGTVARVGVGATLTVDGGSVMTDQGVTAKNSAGAAVYCVTVEGVDFGSGIGDRVVEITGLRGYGKHGIRLIDGKAYLWLPNGDYLFRVGGYPYAAKVSNGPTTASLASGWQMVDYLDWDGSALVPRTIAAYALTRTTVLGDDNWYVVTGKVTTTDLEVSGTAHLILADGAKLTANGGGRHAGVKVSSGNALFIYGQALGTGELEARGDNCGAGVGGNDGETCGSVTINGGVVGAYGGLKGAGIGSGWLGGCGSITINGGRVTAVGKGPDSYGVIYAGAGIGSGVYGFGGTVTINGGTVKATGADGANSYYADDIGVGASARGSAAVTVNGGSVWRTRNRGPQPKDSAQRTLYCVTVQGVADFEKIELPVDYGLQDVHPIGGRIYLWLPNGEYAFMIDGRPYAVKVDGRDATAQPVSAEAVDYVDGNGSGVVQRSVQAFVLPAFAKEIGWGNWYVAKGEVSMTDLEVNGTAHLILADGAKLTVNGTIAGGALAVYGQAAASGILEVTGAIGSPLTVKGGLVRASGGTMSSVTVSAGTASGIGQDSELTVSGGSVLTDIGVVAKNPAGAAVWCVTVEVGSQGSGSGDQAVVVEGLDGYCVYGIQPIAGKVYLWLPSGEYEFWVDGVLYQATVADGPATAHAAIPVDYLDWNGSEMVPSVTNALVLMADITTMGGGHWYVVTGEVETADLKVTGTAHLILADGAKLTAANGIRVTEGNTLGIYAQSEGDDMGSLEAQGVDYGAGIGGRNLESCGTVVICGGHVQTTGGKQGAGIGGGSGFSPTSGNLGVKDHGDGGTITIHGGLVEANGCKRGSGIGGGYWGNGGVITIDGGRVTATGGDEGAAGIGGGRWGGGGTIKLIGGTVRASGSGTAADIGGGKKDSYDEPVNSGSVTIAGGSVLALNSMVWPAPANAMNVMVYCVTVEGLEGLVCLEGLAGYGDRDIHPIDGKIYLYLPNGEGVFSVIGDGWSKDFCYAVNGAPTTAVPYTAGLVGLYVNGVDALYGPREGWTFGPASRILTLDGSIDDYALVGSNTEVKVFVAGTPAVTLYSSAVGAIDVATNANVRLAFSGSGCAIAGDLRLPGENGILEIADGTVEIAGSVVGGPDRHLRISGGSIDFAGGLSARPKDGNGYDLLRTVVVVPDGCPEDVPVKVEGLGSYGVGELYPRNGRLCLWLPDLIGLSSRTFFTVNGDYYCLVSGRDESVEISRMRTGFMVNGYDCATAPKPGWAYDIYLGTLTLDGSVSYGLFCTNVVSGYEVVPTSVGTVAKIHGTVDWRDAGRAFKGPFVIEGGNILAATRQFGVVPENEAGRLLHAVSLTLPDDVDPSVKIELGGLDGYSTEGMFAVGREVCLWLPYGEHDFTVNGARCHAKVDGADTRAVYCSTGVSVDGTDVAAEGGEDWTWSPVTKRLCLENGHHLDSETNRQEQTVYVVCGTDATITGGTSDLPASCVRGGIRITGGSHRFEGAFAVPPSNGVARVWRVEAKVPYGVADGDEVSVSCPNYNGTGIRARNGRVYLWLPDGDSQSFMIDGTLYRVDVKGANAEAFVCEAGLSVNGTDIGCGCGPGWTWNLDGNLRLSGEIGTYVYSGEAENNRVRTTHSGLATLVLSNAIVRVGGDNAAFAAATGAVTTLRFEGPVNRIVGTGSEGLRRPGQALAGEGEYVIAGGTAEIGRSEGEEPSIASPIAINGGSIRIGSEADFAVPPVNAASQRVYRVTVPMPRLADRGCALQVKGLPDYYDVSEIYPYEGDFVDETGSVYLWLPTNSYDFTVGGYRFRATVSGSGWTEAEPVVSRTGVFVNGVDCSYMNDTGWTWSPVNDTLYLSGELNYVISGTNTAGWVSIAVTNAGRATEVVLDDVALSGFTDGRSAIDICPGAELVLGIVGDADSVGSVLEGAPGSYNTDIAGGAGIHVPADAKLTIGGSLVAEAEPYEMLTVSGGRLAAGIGGNAGEAMGKVTVSDHVVTADGGDRGAGIGGGSRGAGGVLRVTGGEVIVFGGAGIDGSGATDDLGGAGIGGGTGGSGGTVTIEGGIVAALGGTGGAVIGGGAGGDGGTLTIGGGTVYPYEMKSSLSGASVFGGGSGGADGVNVFRGGSICVTNGTIRAAASNGSERVTLVPIELPRDPEDDPEYRSHFVRARIDGLPREYGTTDIYTFRGMVYLWLPDGAYEFTLNDIAYSVTVKDGTVTERHYRATGVRVNGRDVCFAEGPGWSWTPATGALSLLSETNYVVTGEAELSNVWVEASGAARVLLSNFTAAASIEVPLQVAENAKASFRFIGEGNRFSAIGGDGTAVVAGGNVVFGRITGESVAVKGGNVFVEGAFPTNRVTDGERPVVPVTITLPESCAADTTVAFAGLPEDYDTAGIRAIGGKVCVWLPYGTYEIDATGYDADGAAHAWSKEVCVFDFGYDMRDLELITVTDDDGLPVVIPRAWVRRYGLVAEDASTADYTNAVRQASENRGIPVWQSFVAGLDPTDSDQAFFAVIEMLPGGAVSVGPNAMRETRVYKAVGSPDLGFTNVVIKAIGASGRAVFEEFGTNGFFRVKVGLE